MAEITVKPIAYIESPFPSKFGIPRQSGLVEKIESRIVFTNEYRTFDAIKGLEDFSHIWLIWNFSESKKTDSLTVRPPRLGGNKRVGVFATRSPFRPNPLGLSCVKILRIEKDPKKGPVIVVSSADLMDGTPIYDIKPYLPHIDAHPDALGGFAQQVKDYKLNVIIPESEAEKLGDKTKETVISLLSNDPRPSYQNDSERIYGFFYDKYEIKFRCDSETITVTQIETALKK